MRSVVVVSLLLAVVAVCAVGCPPPTGNRPVDTRGEGVVLPNGKTFTRAALLGEIADCIVTQQDAFVVDAEALVTATEAAAADPTTKPAAQAAWKTAMDRWQHVEVMQVGPAASSTTTGGEDLRDDIYSWPTISRCAVDELVVSKAYELDTFHRQLLTTRGLSALEQLLFDETEGTSCGDTSAIVSQGTWAALSSEERASRRAAYAVAVAKLTLEKAKTLQTRWAPTGGNFVDELKKAGDGSRFYTRDSLAFNALSDAIFYVEYGTKDGKVAPPAGLSRCESTTCPELLESTLSATSKTNVRANIVAFSQIFGGCNDVEADLGFDDFLIAIGNEALATQLNADVAAALAAVDAIEEPDLLPAIENDLASVEALHTALKAISDQLRTQFVSVLDLEIPKRVEGDND